MAPLPQRRSRLALNGLRWLLLVVGVACIGYVSFSFLDAGLFQMHQEWRLNRTLESTPRLHPATRPPVRTVSSSTGGAIHRAPLAPGSALGRLEISRIGIDAIVAEGVDRRTLRRAVGHLPGTALPGEPGNVVLTGHRDTFFRALRKIGPNDEVVLTTPHGSYRYRVDWTQVVAPQDIGVLDDTGDPILTLVTCYPFYFVGPAPKRFVVRARLR